MVGFRPSYAACHSPLPGWPIIIGPVSLWRLLHTRKTHPQSNLAFLPRLLMWLLGLSISQSADRGWRGGKPAATRLVDQPGTSSQVREEATYLTDCNSLKLCSEEAGFISKAVQSWGLEYPCWQHGCVRHQPTSVMGSTQLRKKCMPCKRRCRSPPHPKMKLGENERKAGKAFRLGRRGRKVS